MVASQPFILFATIVSCTVVIASKVVYPRMIISMGVPGSGKSGAWRLAANYYKMSPSELKEILLDNIVHDLAKKKYGDRYQFKKELVGEILRRETKKGNPDPKRRQDIEEIGTQIYKDARKDTGSEAKREKLVQDAFLNKQSFVYEAVGANADFVSFVQNMVKQARQHGFKSTVVLSYVDSLAKIKQRGKTRADGKLQQPAGPDTARAINEEYLEMAFKNVLGIYSQIQKSVGGADTLFCDNSGAKIHLVLKKSKVNGIKNALPLQTKKAGRRNKSGRSPVPSQQANGRRRRAAAAI